MWSLMNSQLRKTIMMLLLAKKNKLWSWGSLPSTNSLLNHLRQSAFWKAKVLCWACKMHIRISLMPNISPIITTANNSFLASTSIVILLSFHYYCQWFEKKGSPAHLRNHFLTTLKSRLGMKEWNYNNTKQDIAIIEKYMCDITDILFFFKINFFVHINICWVADIFDYVTLQKLLIESRYG